MFAKIVRLSYWLVPILFVSLCPVVVLAQATTAPEKKDEKAVQKPAGHTQSVTGCLQKGDEPGEFSITGEDGKTWGLHSKTVKLEEHVGHKVTVTGSPIHESAAKEKAGKMEKAAGKEEIGDLHVTNLKMVSETCTK